MILLEEATLQRLLGHHFTLHTCDLGYCCHIFLAPERGEDEIGCAIADTLQECIEAALNQVAERRVREIKEVPTRRVTLPGDETL